MAEIIMKCGVCQKLADQKCGGCHNVFYCTKEHQKNDWKNHKKICRPFKICDDENIGRHLIATKPIKEGDVILQEQPLIWGPLQLTRPICLGCGNNITAENCKPCPKCGWPLCSKKCQTNSSHIPECHYTAEKGEKVSITNFDLPHPMYECITTLRSLYQKKFAPDVWEKINKLQSHCEERKNTEVYEHDRSVIAKLIRTFFHLEDEFSEEEILRVCGIITINGHEVPLTTPPHVAIFQLTSMLEHRCRANCYKTYSSQGHIMIIAGVPIQKGEHLSICYTDPLWATFSRQKHLRQTKFFSCTCDRCLDVSEFGTNFSTINCQKDGCDGKVLPKSFLTEGSPWVCKKCKAEMTSESVDKMLVRIGQDLQAMEKGHSEPCRKFLEYYGKLLPQNHFYMIDVKLAWSQIIGQEIKGGLAKVSDEDIAVKINLCRQIYELVLVIAPAEKRLRGALLFELHAGITEMGRRIGQSSTPHTGDFISTLMESKLILTEAVECLKREPDVLQEGKLCQQGRVNLAKLDMFLKNFVRTAENI